MFTRTCLFLGIVIPNIIFIYWYFHEVFHHLSDIDECGSIPAPTCETPKICINTRGGYQCVCDGTQYGDDCQHSKLILLNTLKFTAKHFLTLHSITYHQLCDTVGSVVAGYSIPRDDIRELFSSQLPTVLQCTLLGFLRVCVRFSSVNPKSTDNVKFTSKKAAEQCPSHQNFVPGSNFEKLTRSLLISF